MPLCVPMRFLYFLGMFFQITSRSKEHIDMSMPMFSVIEINNISHRILITDISELEYITELALIRYPLTLDARRAEAYLFNVRLQNRKKGV